MTLKNTKQVRLRQQAIAALITCPTVDAASKQSGLSMSTLNRWMRDEQFAAELAAARNELLNGAIERLKTAAFSAVGTLMEIAANPASSDMARVSASRTLIELALRCGTIQRLEERIAELERAANGAEESSTPCRTLEGNEEQKLHNANDDWGTTTSGFEISIHPSLQ